MSEKIITRCLGIADVQSASVPKGARLLGVRWKGDYVCLSCAADTSLPAETRRIVTLREGGTLPDGDLRYIGALVSGDGLTEYHFFEAGP